MERVVQEEAEVDPLTGLFGATSSPGPSVAAGSSAAAGFVLPEQGEAFVMPDINLSRLRQQPVKPPKKKKKKKNQKGESPSDDAASENVAAAAAAPTKAPPASSADDTAPTSASAPKAPTSAVAPAAPSAAVASVTAAAPSVPAAAPQTAATASDAAAREAAAPVALGLGGTTPTEAVSLESLLAAPSAAAVVAEEDLFGAATTVTPSVTATHVRATGTVLDATPRRSGAVGEQMFAGADDTVDSGVLAGFAALGLDANKQGETEELFGSSGQDEDTVASLLELGTDEAIAAMEAATADTTTAPTAAAAPAGDSTSSTPGFEAAAPSSNVTLDDDLFGMLGGGSGGDTVEGAGAGSLNFSDYIASQATDSGGLFS